MDNMMAYCGLMCSECGAYKATVNNDDEMRKKVSEEWSNAFGTEIKPDEINCMGCKSDLRFGYCNACEIRSCSTKNSYESCGSCSIKNCDKLESIHKYDEAARKRIESFRNI